jgi:hypothetical protein
MSEMTPDQQAELEARSKEIADRLGIDFEELKARAQNNSATEDWNLLKQARFEELVLQEQAEYARCRKARDEVEDMAVVVTPIVEQSPPDPWQAILSTIQNLPNNPEGLERGNGYIKVRSTFLLTDVLGISPEKVNHNHATRLSKAMECLGWEKPSNITIGWKACKGYRKSLDEM